MGLFLIAAGWGGATYLWGSYERAARMNSWVEVPCHIVASEIDGTDANQRGLPKYVARVSYRYEWEGNSYVGERIRRLPVESGERRKIEAIQARYPVGAERTCYVNAEAPEEAVLKKDSKAGLYSIWFPCLFIVGGAGMVGSALFPSGRRTRSGRSADPEPPLA